MSSTPAYSWAADVQRLFQKACKSDPKDFWEFFCQAERSRSMIRYLKILLSPFDSEGVSQYSVIASDRRERGDLSGAIASVTRDCHVAALLAKSVYGAYVVNIHDYDTASPLRVTMLVEYRGEKTPTFAAFK